MKDIKFFAASRNVQPLSAKSVAAESAKSSAKERKREVEVESNKAVSSSYITPRRKKIGCDEAVESVESGKKNFRQSKYKPVKNDIDKEQERILDDFIIGDKKVRSFTLSESLNDYFPKLDSTHSDTPKSSAQRSKYRALQRQLTADIQRIKERAKLKNSKVVPSVSKSIVYKAMNKRCGGMVTLTYYNTSVI
eukprot:TRINITY_DN1170_c0_g3_i1.p2 TRINITY_DN1170_c0_g3~~TRINITY_DN1170_c0_g3_i1.p2  ORF type:complete len:193 (-),score=66.41 TRINITY_DN1170_c0_g3_i1:159-737(-)